VLKTKKVLAAALAGATLAVAATAFGFGGPNSSGNSGHFNPNSNPAQGGSDHPKAPGPH
jgi:hypothetical protein